jgi:hypothetical protein
VGFACHLHLDQLPARQQIMAHNDGLEKRLRAVYDAFDQRNHKVRSPHHNSPDRLPACPALLTGCALLLNVQAAIKLCNAGLQKYPECYTFKSLKSVALERSGKRDEALQVCVFQGVLGPIHCGLGPRLWGLCLCELSRNLAICQWHALHA